MPPLFKPQEARHFSNLSNGQTVLGFQYLAHPHHRPIVFVKYNDCEFINCTPVPYSGRLLYDISLAIPTPQSSHL
jgi:hypothetical protein